MAKHLAFLHLGPGIVGVDAPHEALTLSPAIARAGLAVPDVSSERMSYAGLEISRRHTEAGLTRKSVEGAWAHVCRRLYKARADVVVSQARFLQAPAHQAALALDGLFGFQVHLVLTPVVAPEDPTDLLGPWAQVFTRPDRVHVLETGPESTPESFADAVAATAVRVRGEREARRFLTRRRRAA